MKSKSKVDDSAKRRVRAARLLQAGNKPAEVAWQRVGGNDWCGIAKFLDVKGCTINSGKGEVGSVRTVMVGTTPTVEMAVARTPLSYTYAQPFTPIFYHGTMAVEPTGTEPKSAIISFASGRKSE